MGMGMRRRARLISLLLANLGPVGVLRVRTALGCSGLLVVRRACTRTLARVRRVRNFGCSLGVGFGVGVGVGHGCCPDRRGRIH